MILLVLFGLSVYKCFILIIWLDSVYIHHGVAVIKN